ncbi:MAG: hypothetical protein DCE90_14120 [Pseudanabaena sp.]|nr:MAG: hypothetical protein DCE90_14120 [Pseudanabaena sp.]
MNTQIINIPQQILKRGLAISGTVAIAQIIVNPSFAAPNQLTLSVYPLNSRSGSSPNCPKEVRLTETPRPYTEGSYARDGIAPLGWLAKAFKIERSDKFSAIWVARLQPRFQTCEASASITEINNEPFTGHSYLRMQFVNKNAYLILDMTGMRDANSLTTVILKQDIKNGNPSWAWGGTD